MNPILAEIFHKLVKDNPNIYKLFTKKSIIAYSGGKDSNLLLQFYNYLFKNNISPPPLLFHLNHMIRDNDPQEKEILDFMNSIDFKVYYKKKMFFYTLGF